jgi:signal transduction histidine kinase
VREGEGGGAGLGLTICRGIVGAHGGRVWVEDRPGGGAAFRFTLPLTDDATRRVTPLPRQETSEAP